MFFNDFSHLSEIGKAFLEYQKMVITIVAGMFGGIGKALAISALNFTSVTLNFSIFHTLEVCFYAALSAIMGYLVKSGLDNIISFFRKRKPKKDKENDHE